MASNTPVVNQQDMLHIISEATSGLTGKDLLLELAKKVSLVMGMDYCFIAECADEKKSRLRTVAFVKGDMVLDNVEYNINGSACQMMLEGKSVFVPKGIQEIFPAAKGVEAYIAAPILSTVTGEVLGHIATTN